MREVYGDYESVAGEHPDRLIPEGVRRLAGAAVFLGLIAAMGLWAYRLGTRDAGEVPIVRAMEGPARVQPDDPGGLQAAHQGLEVNSVLAAQPAPVPRELPPPTTPPPALAAEDGPQGELILATPEPLPEPDAAGEELRVPHEAAPGLVEVEPAPEFAAVPGEEPVAPEAGAVAVARPKVRPANLVVARAARTAPAASAPAVVSPASAPAAPAPASATREAASPAAGARMVQLGAYDSEAITRQAWAGLVARHGDLLGAKSLYVERATSNARVFYRLRVAGFESSEQTRVMCESLRARGVDCIPVTLR